MNAARAVAVAVHGEGSCGRNGFDGRDAHACNVDGLREAEEGKVLAHEEGIASTILQVGVMLDESAAKLETKELEVEGWKGASPHQHPNETFAS